MTRHQNNNLKSVHNPFFYIVLAAFFCLFASCEKCIPTILCPYQNPQFFSIQGSDTAFILYPNGFTPNGDGIDDLFNVFTYHVASFSCQIYDAGGRQVYEINNNQPYPWDGLVNGQPAPVGLYALKITAITNLGKPINLAGTLSLVGGQLIVDRIHNIDGNIYWEIKNCQFQSQLDLYTGAFTLGIPPLEPILTDQVHNCR